MHNLLQGSLLSDHRVVAETIIMQDSVPCQTAKTVRQFLEPGNNLMDSPAQRADLNPIGKELESSWRGHSFEINRVGRSVTEIAEGK